MSTEVYRKYIDIINENSQQELVLDEGAMDKVKAVIPKIIKYLGGDAQVIANKVSQATGGDFTPNEENIQKVIRALQLDNMEYEAGGSHVPMHEGMEGIWAKLAKIAPLVAGLTSLASFATGNVQMGTTMSAIALALLTMSGMLNTPKSNANPRPNK